jgi:putative transposase
VSCRFVSEHAGWFPIQRLCELVDVPRSSFYEWSTRPLSEHYLDDAWLANAIYDVHVASRCTYGALRVRVGSTGSDAWW